MKNTATAKVVIDPVAIDTEIARLQGEIAKYVNRNMHYSARERAMKDPNSKPWERRPLTASELEDRESNRRMITALDSELAPLNSLYATHGWNRYFWVQNAGGHLHTTTHCTTCFATTRFGWVTAVSGKSYEEVVEEYGTDVCTVCIPSAPVMKGWGTSKSQKEKAAARAEREAKRNERAAKVAALSLVQPIKTASHGRIDKIAEATRVAVDCIVYDRFDSDSCKNLDYLARMRADIPVLVEALALKSGETPEAVLATLVEKAKAKHIKDLKTGIKSFAQFRFAYRTPEEADAALAGLKAKLEKATGKPVK